MTATDDMRTLTLIVRDAQGNYYSADAVDCAWHFDQYGGFVPGHRGDKASMNVSATNLRPIGADKAAEQLNLVANAKRMQKQLVDHQTNLIKTLEKQNQNLDAQLREQISIVGREHREIASLKRELADSRLASERNYMEAKKATEELHRMRGEHGILAEEAALKAQMNDAKAERSRREHREREMFIKGITEPPGEVRRVGLSDDALRKQILESMHKALKSGRFAAPEEEGMKSPESKQLTPSTESESQMAEIKNETTTPDAPQPQKPSGLELGAVLADAGKIAAGATVNSIIRRSVAAAAVKAGLPEAIVEHAVFKGIVALAAPTVLRAIAQRVPHVQNVKSIDQVLRIAQVSAIAGITQETVEALFDHVGPVFKQIGEAAGRVEQLSGDETEAT